MNEKNTYNTDARTNLCDCIIDLEWKQFDKVRNKGGRAACQDDWKTFFIMRKSQYMTWTEELLESYYQDLKDSEARGWNMVAEKYARMMESTAPAEYEQIEETLPKRDQARIQLQEELIRVQVKWAEEFAGEYPGLSGRGRSIHTWEDKEDQTSYETYLRGEMGTYSDRTMQLYEEFVRSLEKKKECLAKKIMENTVKMYGYKNLEEAEKIFFTKTKE